MPTHWSAAGIAFGRAGGRELVAAFDGGRVTSEAGALLLGATDQAIRLVDRFASCFRDGRHPAFVTHRARSLVGQRIFGLALGYEDLVDHDDLRHDPVLGALLGRFKPDEAAPAPLAGKSTLNRLEHAPVDATARYHKIGHEAAAIETVFVALFLDTFGAKPPREIILDLDATDDPIHGHQEGRFFHGYYDCYCYLPLYIFCGDHVLCARLRQSHTDASAGSLTEIQRVITQLRAAWPDTRIILRGDSGFCRNQLMSWCESNNVDYVFGLARNQRLRRIIGRQMWEATEEWNRTGKPARIFAEFSYATKSTKKRPGWDRERRVVAKAEHIDGKENPRFVVTSLNPEQWPARSLYEELYCARGDMENRIKEQFSLFADRVSAETMRANQLRLSLSVMAYVLVSGLRRLGLKATEMADAQVNTIRTRLLKIGAQIRVSVRRVRVSLSSAFPSQPLFQQVWANLRC